MTPKCCLSTFLLVCALLVWCLPPYTVDPQLPCVDFSFSLSMCGLFCLLVIDLLTICLKLYSMGGFCLSIPHFVLSSNSSFLDTLYLFSKFMNNKLPIGVKKNKQKKLTPLIISSPPHDQSGTSDPSVKPRLPAGLLFQFAPPALM